MATRQYPTLTDRILDKVVDRLGRRLDGPVIRFTNRSPGSNPGHVGAACMRPLAGDTEVGFLQAQDPGAVGAAPEPPAVSTSTPPASETAAADPWPPGAGRHANNCLFLDDARHECLNSYGWPIRPGQDCWHSARMESLRSFTDTHPAFARLVNPEGRVA